MTVDKAIPPLQLFNQGMFLKKKKKKHEFKTVHEDQRKVKRDVER